MDNLRALAAFVAAVEGGSFSAAARQLEMTAVMVGKHVRQMERELGVRLLERNTRRQHLTEAGQLWYTEAKHILSRLQWARGRVDALKRFPSGCLRLSAPTTLGSTLIASLAAQYQQSWPDVRIELTLSDRYVDLIAEGFDLAIRIGDLPIDSPLVACYLGEYQMVICATPHYLAQHGTPRQPGDLPGHRCLGNLLWNKRNAWRLGEIPLWPDTTTFDCNDGQALRQAALAGAGLILQPLVLLAEDIAAGRLVRLLDHALPAARPIHLLWHQDHHASAKRRSFVDFLGAHAPPRLAPSLAAAAHFPDNAG
ncbi:LysR family transcriptional regulator [Pantoea sp. 1.19]|uniref:LysR family transcriptional regulator n=1 Tax=Pantoea sp. 1.19 TaxID=1925589 RepID=UPI000948F3A0|nr:LysR family transcriptional regulator [Pantoea sp. 1.19]